MKNKIDNLLSVPRIFTYDQLVKISDENLEVLNRNIDPMKIDPKALFVLTPVIIHNHAFGKLIFPHIRASIKCESEFVGYQDLTFDQFRTGKVAA